MEIITIKCLGELCGQVLGSRFMERVSLRFEQLVTGITHSSLSHAHHFQRIPMSGNADHTKSPRRSPEPDSPERFRGHAI